MHSHPHLDNKYAAHCKSLQKTSESPKRRNPRTSHHPIHQNKPLITSCPDDIQRGSEGCSMHQQQPLKIVFLMHLTRNTMTTTPEIRTAIQTFKYNGDVALWERS